jgi:hypothetical protein
MTPLFRRLQPAQKFRISHATIAKFLKVPKHLIVRVESWAYIVFVHRRDKGGQFISYRQLRQWFNAIACQIQHCTTCQQLRQLWLAIESDRKRHHKQYNHQHISIIAVVFIRLPLVLKSLQYPVRRGELAQFQCNHQKTNKKSDASQIL